MPGVRFVPHLRRLRYLFAAHPALTRGANFCRAYGAGGWVAQGEVGEKVLGAARANIFCEGILIATRLGRMQCP